MMSDILLQILNVSLFTSIIIGILLLLVPLLQKRYRAKWRYTVWLVIAIRLLIPAGVTLPQAPISIALPEPVREVVYPSVNMPEQPGVTVQNPSTSSQPQGSEWPEANNAAQDTHISEAYTTTTALPPVSLTPIELAALVWLAGVIAFLLVQIGSYLVFLHRLKSAETEPAPAFIKEVLWQLGVGMGVCKLPEPVITNAVDAPVLIGVLRPRILLPRSQYENEALLFILRHELVHYRRKDMAYKLILMLANALHWFNPMIYLMTAQAAKDIELACDDEVARELDKDARARYGDTILSALPKKRRLEPVFSTHFGSGKKNIKRRLRNLFDTTAKRQGTMALCAVILCMSIVTSFVTLSYAADSAPVKAVTNTSVTNQKPLQNMTVHASANDGTWAAASSIEGKTWQKQIDDEIKWLNDTYAENESAFVITEALPKSEASNVSRINYLNNSSDVFREMSKMNNGVYIIEDGHSFTGSGFTLTTDMIHRTAVMAENDNDLYLDVNYSLTEGKMAVWLIGPDGTVVYQGGIHSTYKGVRKVTGKKGLWSVIRVCQSNDEGSMSGNIAISLRQNKVSQAILSVPINGVTSQTEIASTEAGQPYFQIVSNNGKNVAHSGSFVAQTGQKLTITAESGIKGGTVDLFLFSPSGKEQRFTFGGTGKTATVELTAGTWAYNCTGFYESGSIVITGVIENTSAVGEQAIKTGTEKYDNEAIRKMDASGTWGEYINQSLPNMSPGAVEKVVEIYLDRHLFPGITTPQGARQVASTIAPALAYMTKEARESAEKRIAAYY